MCELSVIIPTVNEWPQVLFTIRSVMEELEGIDYEILVVDNYCKELLKQRKVEDPTRKHLEEVEKGQKRIRYLRYDKKLSNWNSRRTGIEAAKANIFWICDAHCVPARDSLRPAFRFYQENHESLKGTVHLPLTYSILEWRKLQYALVTDISKASYHYRFCSFKGIKDPLVNFQEVPVMSTCGMLMTKDLYNAIGGIPPQMGIYGGGENFFNFTLAVLGYKKYVFGDRPLYHHGDKRGYSWNGDDHLRNRALATYIFGGQKAAKVFMKNCRGRDNVKQLLLNEIFNNPVSVAHQKSIQDKLVIPINDWVHKWDE